MYRMFDDVEFFSAPSNVAGSYWLRATTRLFINNSIAINRWKWSAIRTHKREHHNIGTTQTLYVNGNTWCESQWPEFIRKRRCAQAISKLHVFLINYDVCMSAQMSCLMNVWVWVRVAGSCKIVQIGLCLTIILNVIHSYANKGFRQHKCFCILFQHFDRG